MVGSLSAGRALFKHSSTRKGISVSTISTRCASAGPSTGYSSARPAGEGKSIMLKQVVCDLAMQIQAGMSGGIQMLV